MMPRMMLALSWPRTTASPASMPSHQLAICPCPMLVAMDIDAAIIVVIE